jgi:hypothetical protein
VFSPAQAFQSDGIKAILTGRLEATLKRNGADSAFVLLPLDTLLGDDGIVAALRKHGKTVTSAA